MNITNTHIPQRILSETVDEEKWNPLWNSTQKIMHEEKCPITFWQMQNFDSWTAITFVPSSIEVIDHDQLWQILPGL